MVIKNQVKYFQKSQIEILIFWKYVKVYIKLVGTKGPQHNNVIKCEHCHLSYGQIIAISQYIQVIGRMKKKMCILIL